MSEMTDEQLISYCEIHCETERALFNQTHVNRMFELAGSAERVTGWVSMKEEMRELCVLARERLKRQAEATRSPPKASRQSNVINLVPQAPFEPKPIWIDYTNWRGERAVRKIHPISVEHCATQHHPDTQWLLNAVDLDRHERQPPQDGKSFESKHLRAFALKDIARIFTTEPTNQTLCFHSSTMLSLSAADLIEAAGAVSGQHLVGTSNWAAAMLQWLCRGDDFAQNENRRLRKMLCQAHAGHLGYYDDGCAQDNRENPAIDFMKDSLDDIEKSMRLRALNALNSKTYQLPKRDRPFFYEGEVTDVEVISGDLVSDKKLYLLSKDGHYMEFRPEVCDGVMQSARQLLGLARRLNADLCRTTYRIAVANDHSGGVTPKQPEQFGVRLV